MKNNELTNKANNYIEECKKRQQEREQKEYETAKENLKHLEDAVNNFAAQYKIKPQYKSIFIVKVRDYIIGCKMLKELEIEKATNYITKDLMQMHRILTNSLNKAANEIIKFIDKYSEDIKA